MFKKLKQHIKDISNLEEAKRKLRARKNKYDAQDEEIKDLLRKRIESLEERNSIGRKLNEILRNQRKTEEKLNKLLERRRRK